jgi:hypothetical protein
MTGQRSAPNPAHDGGAPDRMDRKRGDRATKLCRAAPTGEFQRVPDFVLVFTKYTTTAVTPVRPRAGGLTPWLRQDSRRLS